MMGVANNNALELPKVAEMNIGAFMLAAAYNADINYTEKQARPKR